MWLDIHSLDVGVTRLINLKRMVQSMIGQILGYFFRDLFGYHIFQVKGRRSAKKIALKEVKKRISSQLLAEREQEAYSRWLEAEILAAKVYKNDALIRDIKVFTRSKE